MDEACSTNLNDKKWKQILVGKPEWKKLIERPRLRWKNNTKMDLKTFQCESVDWIHLAEDGTSDGHLWTR
jgi:hypothetical protein